MLALRWLDLADLAVVWFLMWLVLVALRAARARLALAGVGIVLVVYLVARQFGLPLTTQILQAFVAVSVIVGVVLFQEDLRRLFEQIASVGLRRGAAPGLQSDQANTLARAMVSLAEGRRGALVVLPGRGPLDRHLDGGVELDAVISEPLLLSLFDPHSPGHDGAILVEAGRVKRFAIHLPLSSDHAQLRDRGTRHAAGLGLAELSDALCLIVSEERGTISVARDGRLRKLASPGAVIKEIEEFLGAQRADGAGAGFGLLTRWKEAVGALGLAALIWVLAIPGGAIIEVDREVPVTVRGLPPGHALVGVDPPVATLRLAAPRRDLLLLDSDDVKLTVDAILARLGRRTFQLSDSLVETPPGVEVRAIEPESIKIELMATESEGSPPATR